MDAKLEALMAEIEAKGWPHYDVDPELCMARAKEFLDGRDALLAAEESL